MRRIFAAAGIAAFLALGAGAGRGGDLAGAAGGGLAGAVGGGLAGAVGGGLAAAVSAWLESLEAPQLEAARYEFDDDERFDLRLAPMGLEGLRGDEMSESQWRAWLAALGSQLSELGRRKLHYIMSLEREMARVDREASFWRRWFGGFFRGERRYFASVYGDPGADTPWGLRFDGHHLSLNWTFVPGERPSMTPLFLGSHPREVPEGWERQGLRVLSEEEDRGHALWNALDPEQRSAAELPFRFAGGLGGGRRANFVGSGERIAAAEPAGVAHRELDFEARKALDGLIDTYLGNFAWEIARERRAAIDAAGRGEIRFAYAGSLARGEAGYYRVQGPTFLIEWDNSAREADHVHAIYRDFEGDFGRDLLAEHLARDHSPRQLAGR